MSAYLYLCETLPSCQQEIDGWRKARTETGYLQIVAVCP